METRMELQRLLEDMDKMIRRKQEELSELDERLELARARVSESEAQELLRQQRPRDISGADEAAAPPPEGSEQRDRADWEEALREQRRHYEQQIGRLTEELVELEAANGQLIKLNNRLRAECDSLRAAGEKLHAQMRLADESLEEARAANFELNIRLAKAEGESQMQQRLLKKSHQQDQLLMDAFNSKLESLRVSIAARDTEIARLRADDRLTLESLGIRADDESGAWQDGGLPDGRFQAPTDGDGLIDSAKKQRIIQIGGLIRERDAQIELLKEQLIQVTCELESNTNLLQRLTSERKLAPARAAADDDDESHEAGAPGSLAAKCQMLETELQVKDEQLNRIEWRNRELELALPVKVAATIEKLNWALGRVDWAREERPLKLAESEADDDKNLGLLLGELSGQLAELLARFESAQAMLMSVEKQQVAIKNKDAQIRRLVRELNRLSAQINQDQIDLADIESGAEQLASSSTVASESHSTRLAADRQPTSQPGQLEAAGPNVEGRMGDNEQMEPTCNNDDSIVLKQAGEQAPSRLASAPLEWPAREDISLANGRRRSRPKGRPKRRNIRRKSSDWRRFAAGNKRRSLVPSDQLQAANELGGKLGSQSEQSASNSPTSTAVCEARRGSSPGDGNDLGGRHLERALELQQRLSEVENENQLLELAMKEILVAVKWCDTRCSSLLIDCPSLERLCQLIEARFIAEASRAQASGQLSDCVRDLPSQPAGEPSGGLPTQYSSTCDLFQFVVLKSELDLIRGQNEQLRADLKLQRRECHEQLMSAKGVGSADKSEESRPEVDVDNMDGPGEDVSRPQGESFKFAEAEIQTDSSIEAVNVEEETVAEEKCAKCPRLVELAHHLLACFLRIESRVSESDEANIKRLVAFYQLSQRLSQDLKNRERVIARHQQDLQSMTQQRVLAESKVRFLEVQLAFHKKHCPLDTRNHASSAIAIHERPSGNYVQRQAADEECAPSDQVQIYASTNGSQLSQQSMSTFSMQQGRKRYARGARVERGSSSGSMAMVELKREEPRERPSNKVTVALLQSIIACLQARLDYKDERLNQLERMLAGEVAG